MELTSDIIEDLIAPYSAEVLDRFSAIRACEDFSLQTLDKIRSKIAHNSPPLLCDVDGLAVAGSLARLEASGQSDLDLIAIVSSAENDKGATEQFKHWRSELCVDLGLDTPNPYGVFEEPISRQSIVQISGGADEPYTDVSERVLFLLESNWVYNESSHDKILTEIISAYSEDVAMDGRKNFIFLLNDVIRYFRTICVNYQHNKAQFHDGKWPIRNVKLRHSRVMMYFSMVSVLGTLSLVAESGTGERKIGLLGQFCRLSPLRRMFVAYKMSGDSGFYKVAGLYNTFLTLLANKAVRDELKGLEYDQRYNSNNFSMLKANSDALASELHRFYEARRHFWDDRYFEYMII